MLFSADLGNGYIKCKSSMADGVSYPAALSILSDMLSDFELGLHNHNSNFVIGFEGERYAIGESVKTLGLTPVTIAHSSRIKTDYYRVLFASALGSTIWQSGDVTTIVSLPPAHYWDKDALKQVIAGEYIVDLPGYGKTSYRVPADRLAVIPEGVGAACLMALNPDGSDRPGETLSQQTVGIVDIGTYTTDLIQLDRLHIVRSGCDSLPHAMHDVHERLKGYCQSQGYDLDHYRVDEVLQAGYFMRSGVRHSIMHYIDQWTGQLIPAISGLIRTTWNGGDDCDSILLCGGGAIYVYDRLAMEFPQLRLIEEVPAHMANCEGAFRYLTLRERSK